MPLSAGERLGPYEILSPIGEGGMGEVYKARDTRLDRSVAIKTSKSEFTERFEREARAVAALNHPNICQLYDVGHNYLVMELIEGNPLKGPLPLDKAIEAASQILDALDAAHRKGITHRDLKPANILATKQGIKLLDFGLATQGATLQQTDNTITTEGQIVGTLQYMAPEQLQGKPADARSDIFAFGCVLYELLSGKRAFQGDSPASIIAAILEREPEPLATTPTLDRLIRKCLAKDPDDRFQTARDLKYNLTLSPETTATNKAPSKWLWALTATLLLTTLAATALWLRKSTPATALPTEFAITMPEGGRLADAANIGGVALSPDGRTIAFVATTSKGATLLHLRNLDSIEAKPIEGTEAATRPFWSPDSKALALYTKGKLVRVDIASSTITPLCGSRIIRGGAWNQDGTILFSTQQTGIQSVSSSGGNPVTVTQWTEGSHYYPQFLPGGKSFLYLFRSRDSAKSGIYTSSLDGSTPSLLVRTQYRAEYDPASGRLLYVQDDGTLLAQHLDLNSLRLTGEPSRSSFRVETLQGGNGYAVFSLATNGSILYSPQPAPEQSHFAWRDRKGNLLEVQGEPITDLDYFSLSPDNSQLAFAVGGIQRSIWVQQVPGGSRIRATFSSSYSPQWSADGKQLLYGRSPGGLFRKSSDGSGEEELVVKGSNLFPRDTANGNHLIVSNGDIYIVIIEANPTMKPWMQTGANEGNGRFSPDGRWIAYNSDESGIQEIYIQGFPDRRGKWQISTAGGVLPYWRADGKELFWRAPDQTLMSASIQLLPSAVASQQPKALFTLKSNHFDVARDGQRFLFGEPVKPKTQDNPLILIQNCQSKW